MYSRSIDRIVCCCARGLLCGLLLVTTLSDAQARDVRVGIYNNPPKIFVDGGSQAGGIFPRLLELIAQQEGWRIHYVPCTWRACLQQLRDGHIDLMPDVALNEERQRELDFHATPALYSWSQVYRNPRIDIDSVFDLDNKRVALLRDSIQQSEFDNMIKGFGLRTTLIASDSFDEAFQLVHSGAADAVVANHLYGGYKAAEYGLVETPILFQPSRLYFATARGRQGDLLAAIERHLANWRTDPGSPYYQVLEEWDQRVPEALIPPAYRLALIFILSLLVLSGLVALLLNRRLAVKTRHLVDSRNRLQATLDDLRESEERYRLAFKTSPDAVTINRLEDGAFLDTNAGFEALTGWRGEEVLGRNSTDIGVWADAADHARFTEAMRSRGYCEQLQADFLTKTGERRTGMLSAKVIPLGGEPCILSITRDITEFRRTTELLNKLSVAVEQSPAAIVVTDLEACIEYVNETFVRMTGYSREDVIGRNPRFQQSGQTPAKTYEEMWAHLSRGEVWRGELFNRRKDGSHYVESILIYPVRQSGEAVSHYLAIKEDISEKIHAEQRIHNLAYYDQLTGLPNRSLLKEHFHYALSLAQRSDEPLTIMVIDLDDFKNINDTLGHSLGDKVLIEVSNRLLAHLREEDTVARMGGDEFTLLLPRTDEHGAARVASKLIEQISLPCHINGNELIVTPSIGITIAPHDGREMEVLLQNADAAMYRVKQDSRYDFRFFTQEMQLHSARNLHLANALRHALQRDQLLLHYQPQIDLGSGQVVGVEALLRWCHPEFGVVSPAEFIPIAEESGQIIRIGEWVLQSATAQLRQWLDRGVPPITMAVNISAAQFRHSGLQATVLAALERAGLPSRHLELELTEAVAMKNPREAAEIMDNLHAQGIRLSIDDFGTGYSSLSYLKRFNMHKIKIDQSFVRDLMEDAEDKAIVTAIIHMADSLGIRTIAEGVETEDQLRFLKRQGCDQVQGYHISKPLPAAEIEPFLRAHAADTC